MHSPCKFSLVCVWLHSRFTVQRITGKIMLQFFFFILYFLVACFIHVLVALDQSLPCQTENLMMLQTTRHSAIGLQLSKLIYDLGIVTKIWSALSCFIVFPLLSYCVSEWRDKLLPRLCCVLYGVQHPLVDTGDITWLLGYKEMRKSFIDPLLRFRCYSSARTE